MKVNFVRNISVYESLRIDDNNIVEISKFIEAKGSSIVYDTETKSGVIHNPITLEDGTSSFDDVNFKNGDYLLYNCCDGSFTVVNPKYYKVRFDVLEEADI